MKYIYVLRPYYFVSVKSPSGCDAAGVFMAISEEFL